MNTDLFLEGALERYKGFLHLIRRNKERSIRRFCVPTYDIDLIWHTHQLHPLSYCKDMVQLLGKILEHDDMDADRSKGTKLDVGFSSTTKQWEDSFGSRYWRAGAMYRGSAPDPVTKTPYPFQTSVKKMVSMDDSRKILQLPELKYVEVTAHKYFFSTSILFLIVQLICDDVSAESESLIQKLRFSYLKHKHRP